MIIYSTPSCPRCKTLVAALHAAGIPYEEKPLDTECRVDCACATGILVREAPLVYADGKWIFANQLFRSDGSLLPGWKEMLCQMT